MSCWLRIRGDLRCKLCSRCNQKPFVVNKTNSVNSINVCKFLSRATQLYLALYCFSVFASRAQPKGSRGLGWLSGPTWEMWLLLFCQLPRLAIFPSLRQIFHQQSKSRKWSPQWGRNGSTLRCSRHSSFHSSFSSFCLLPPFIRKICRRLKTRTMFSQSRLYRLF